MRVSHFKHSVECDGLSVQYDLCCPGSYSGKGCSSEVLPLDEKLDYEQRIAEFEKAYGETLEEIERLTNHADGPDYAIAVSSGLIAGLIDVFYVGDFGESFASSHAKIDEYFKKIVSDKAAKIEEGEKKQKIQEAIESAKRKAEEKGSTLSDEKIAEIKQRIENSYLKKNDLSAKIDRAMKKAQSRGMKLSEQEIENIKNKDFARKVRIVEEAFGIPSDSTGVWNGAGNGIDAKSHHLDDLAHHPTIIGWAASVVTQFTEKAYFQNKDGENFAFGAQRIKVIIKRGKSQEIQLIGETVQEKVVCGTINWIGHLISDMAGSSSSAAKGRLGMGLPGPIMSALKELSMLPIFKDTNLPGLLHKAFTTDNGFFNQYRLDMRTELAAEGVLLKQAVPVLLNELFVRLSYFIRRLYQEIKNNGVSTIKDIKKINWKNTLPVKNRTIARMLTISAGTMEVIDLMDAAVRSGGNPVAFVLRVNFIGVGRFAIASSVDLSMGAKKDRLELAMASAEVAKTAQVLTSTISSVDDQRKQTRKILGDVTAEIDGYSAKARRKNMGYYTIHDIQVDTDILTLEDVIEASNQIFDLQETDFNVIRNQKWYHDFKRAITFHADDRRKMISDITSVSKLQQLFMLVYAQYFKNLDKDLESTITVVRKINDKINKLYQICVAKIELQEDIGNIPPYERGILQLFLNEYSSQNGNEEKFKRYRRQIMGLFRGGEPCAKFDSTQLSKVEHPAPFYRCACELCAIDGNLNGTNPEFPGVIVSALNELNLSRNKCQEIATSVMQQAEKLGIDYFLQEKYQSDEFDTDGIDLVNYQENISYEYPCEEVTADRLTDKRIYISTPQNASEKNAAKLLRIKLEDTSCKLVKSVEDAQYKIFFPSSGRAKDVAKIAKKILYNEDKYGITILRSKAGGKNIYLKYDTPDIITDNFRKAMINAYREQTDDTDLEKAINTWSVSHTLKDKSEYRTHKAKKAVDNASQTVKDFSKGLLQGETKNKKSPLSAVGKKVVGSVLQHGSTIVQGAATGSCWVWSKVEEAGDKHKTTLADTEFDKKVLPEIQCKILAERLFDLLVSGEL